MHVFLPLSTAHSITFVIFLIVALFTRMYFNTRVDAVTYMVMLEALNIVGYLFIFYIVCFFGALLQRRNQTSPVPSPGTGMGQGRKSDD